MFPANEWYDEECKIYKAQLRKFVKYPIGTYEYTEYWKLKQINHVPTQRKKRKYNLEIANQVENMCLKNPTQYWNFWKKNTKKASTTHHLNADMFREHYIRQNQISTDENFDHHLMSHITHFIDSESKSFNIDADDVLGDILNGLIDEDELRFFKEVQKQ